MKSLLVFARIVIVGLLWGIVFTEGIRVIMLCNWHFDIFWPDHWRQAQKLWQAGWTVRAPKEWAFVIIIATFIPMLLTGWWTLCLVSWEDLIYKALTAPIALYRRLVKAPINMITTNNKYGVVKKKSYKLIRPTGVNGVRSPISDYNDNVRPSNFAPIQSGYTTPAGVVSPAASATAASARVAAKAVKADIPATIDHALFKFDDDDDDFDFDIDSFEKTDFKKRDNTDNKQNKRRDDADNTADNRRQKRSNKKDDTADNRSKNKKDREQNNSDNRKEKAVSGENQSTHGPVYDALAQKGYDVITDVPAGNTTIDFVGASENEICLCLTYKESGDWLADEELFNGEEPLWFSENSHCVSPVRKLLNARDYVVEKLNSQGFDQKVTSFVIIQAANIINADDMFDIWSDLNIEVTRINRGSPKEIRLFSKTLHEAENPISKNNMEKLRKTLKNTK